MPPASRFWIVGAGGIGCTLGARLARHHDVLLVDPWREHMEAIRANDLTVEYPDEKVTVAVDTACISDLGSVDEEPRAVLLAVKSYQTEETVLALLRHLGPGTPIVSLQNCINEDVIAGLVGADRTIGAMVRFDGALLGPGHARATRTERRLAVGELDGAVTDRVRALQRVLSCSVDTDISQNIWGELWAKLVRNAAVNAVSVIGRFGMGQLVTTPLARRVALAAGMETVRVALALGIVLDPTELDGPPEAYLRPFDSPETDVLEATLQQKFGAYPTVKASMLQDIEKGRKTEIEQMNGYVVKRGREVGVRTPVNHELVKLVEAVESGSGLPHAAADNSTFERLLDIHSHAMSAEESR
jgi:2-dehydropantoate 2-reductase